MFRLQRGLLILAIAVIATALSKAEKSHAQTAGPTSDFTRAWPADVDPNSGFRLPLRNREDLDDSGKKAYDHGTNSGSIAGLQGPAGIYLYSKAGQQFVAINSFLRRDAGISPRIREIAILTTAREFDSQFEWSAHEPVGLKAGVPPAVIDTIKNRKSLAGLDPTDALVIEVGRDLWRTHKVPPATFAKANEAFGPQRLVDLVLLMGNYASTAALLTAVDMQLNHGERPLLPIP